MDDFDEVLNEQIAYYDARAPVLDDVYARVGSYDEGPEINAEWLDELAVVERALEAWPCTGEVLELGCGTGFWTARLAPHVQSITAWDASPTMLAVAAHRLAEHRNVHLRQADLIRNWAPQGQYDGLVAFFFLEHVPDPELPSLLERAVSALPPGGHVFVAEGRYLGPYGPVEQRQLAGTSYRVIEQRRSPDQFAAFFAPLGVNIEFESTPRHFCYGSGQRH